jgi:predicted transglutaminase-like cysteine proteinase
MPTSNTNPKLDFACLPARQGFRIFIVFGLAFCSLLGCIQKSDLEQARQYAQKSENYYTQAAKQYRHLVAQGKDLDKLYFELGKLYYDHGEFAPAIESLRKTNDKLAKKLLAISLYRLGKFSDALEIFDKQKIPDDEYLYYEGLTCEGLNLFDRSLQIYKKIKNKAYASLALERINRIEKETGLFHIKDISPKIYQILSSAPSAQNYPQAGALILSCDEKIEVSREGTQISYLHYLVKILNERGKEDFSEAHIDYDSTFEKVELEFARTIKPDGRVVEVGSRHIRDVSKYLNFPLYSNVRVFIISFPEIAEGSVIEYKLKLYRSQLINKKDLVISYPVQSQEPIILADFSVVIPQERELHAKVINEKYNDFGACLNPSIEEKDGQRLYHWQFKEIPQIIPEANMPANVEINPIILLSTFDGWQDIYNWWWKLAEEKIRSDSAIKDKVRELIKGKISKEEKLRAIYNFCAKEIRYVAVEYGQAGYEPHYATDIFKNKYGDCKDQTILLATMLKEAGLSGYPVLIATKDYYNLNEDFPASFFNHVICAVDLDDKTVFLDPTAETCSFGDLPADDQARRVLVIKEAGFKIQETPLYPAGHNLNKQILILKINNDESLSASKSIFTYGVYDQAQRFWMLYTQPELIQETLKEKIQDISIGAKLIKYDIQNLQNLNKPVLLSYSFGGPEYFTVAGNLRIMPQLAGLDTSLVAKDRRKYSLDFGILDERDMQYEIEIPANFVIKYIPQNVIEDSPWLRFNVAYSYKKNKIYFAQKTELKKNKVLESEYPEFKKFIERIAKQVKQRPVLEKIQENEGKKR